MYFNIKNYLKTSATTLKKTLPSKQRNLKFRIFFFPTISPKNLQSINRQARKSVQLS